MELADYVTKHRVVKTYGRLKVLLHALLTRARWWKWSASCSGRFIPGTYPRYPLDGVGRDSIATRYGLGGPGIESRWGRDFPHPSRPSLGPPSLLYNGYRVSFPGVKRMGRGVDHPPPSRAEVRERVELYFYYSFGPSWPVLALT
jgi:hypothetical protein